VIQLRDYAIMDGFVNVPVAARTAAGAIVRCVYTYAGHAFVDTAMMRDRAAWHAAGKAFGAYMILGWNKTGPSPKDQVATFIKAYGDRQPGEFYPSLDLEADSALALGRTPTECLAWAHEAFDALIKQYRVVFIYTSERVWSDVFGDLPSRMGTCPLWVKIPYPWRARNAHHPESCPAQLKPAWIPRPWQAPTSPGAWLMQYQGDAVGVPGFAGTVDCNVWLTLDANVETSTGRAAFVGCHLDTVACGAFGATVENFQREHGLTPDRKVGPATFSYLFA
jgi:peptidoglycan hydrolase-like protein with peptidoglycan-binding domain